MQDHFGSRSTFIAGGRELHLARLDALEKQGLSLTRLPYALRILLENLLRREDGVVVQAEEIEALAKWDPKAEPSREIAFMPARVLLQDFTGVPAVVDLAAMRDAMAAMGGDPRKINPLQPRRSSSATVSAMRSCAGARRRSTTSAWCRRTPASSTRSTWSTWRGWL
jgi:aconitate hydratase